MLPELGDRLDALVRRLGGALPAGLPLVPAHGDFHVDQLLVRDGDIAVVDFDELCVAAPALDLATYAADVVRGRAGDLERVQAVLEPLLEGYGARPDALDWHLAAAVLARAAHPFQRQVRAGASAWRRPSPSRRRALARALVTGCAGFIGSQVAEALLADGHEVRRHRLLHRQLPARAQAGQPRPRARARPLHVRQRRPRDRRRRARCSTAATSSSTSPPSRACARAGASGSTATCATTSAPPSGCWRRRRATPERRIVYASSSSVYGESEALPTPEDATPQPLSPYGVTKLAAEQLCRLYHAEHGVDAVALRFFSVYGPRQRPDMAFRRFCEAAAAGAPIEIYGDGRQTRDFTFVGDVVAAVLAAGARPTGSAARSTTSAAARA